MRRLKNYMFCILQVVVFQWKGCHQWCRMLFTYRHQRLWELAKEKLFLCEPLQHVVHANVIGDSWCGQLKDPSPGGRWQYCFQLLVQQSSSILCSHKPGLQHISSLFVRGSSVLHHYHFLFGPACSEPASTWSLPWTEWNDCNPQSSVLRPGSILC